MLGLWLVELTDDKAGAVPTTDRVEVIASTVQVAATVGGPTTVKLMVKLDGGYVTVLATTQSTKFQSKGSSI